MQNFKIADPILKSWCKLQRAEGIRWRSTEKTTIFNNSILFGIVDYNHLRVLLNNPIIIIKTTYFWKIKYAEANK